MPQPMVRLSIFCLAAVALADPILNQLLRRGNDNQLCAECTPSPDDCDATAPCSNFMGVLYCAWLVVDALYHPCKPIANLNYHSRPGYRTDRGYQWKLDVPGHEHRVWVAPGVECDTLCDNPTGTDICNEVVFQDDCLPEDTGENSGDNEDEDDEEDEEDDSEDDTQETCSCCCQSTQTSCCQSTQSSSCC